MQQKITEMHPHIFRAIKKLFDSKQKYCFALVGFLIKEKTIPNKLNDFFVFVFSLLQMESASTFYYYESVVRHFLGINVVLDAMDELNEFQWKQLG